MDPGQPDVLLYPDGDICVQNRWTIWNSGKCDCGTKGGTKLESYSSFEPFPCLYFIHFSTHFLSHIDYCPQSSSNTSLEMDDAERWDVEKREPGPKKGHDGMPMLAESLSQKNIYY